MWTFTARYFNFNTCRIREEKIQFGGHFHGLDFRDAYHTALNYALDMKSPEEILDRIEYESYLREKEA